MWKGSRKGATYFHIMACFSIHCLLASIIGIYLQIISCLIFTFFYFYVFQLLCIHHSCSSMQSLGSVLPSMDEKSRP